MLIFEKLIENRCASIGLDCSSAYIWTSRPWLTLRSSWWNDDVNYV